MFKMRTTGLRRSLCVSKIRVFDMVEGNANVDRGVPSQQGIQWLIRREDTKVDGSVCTTREDQATNVNDHLS